MADTFEYELNDRVKHNLAEIGADKETVITANCTFDSTDYKKITVNVEAYPEPTGSTVITANGTSIDVKDYAMADVQVEFNPEDLDPEYIYSPMYVTNSTWSAEVVAGHTISASTTNLYYYGLEMNYSRGAANQVLTSLEVELSDETPTVYVKMAPQSTIIYGKTVTTMYAYTPEPDSIILDEMITNQTVRETDCLYSLSVATNTWGYTGTGLTKTDVDDKTSEVYYYTAVNSSDYGSPKVVSQLDRLTDITRDDYIQFSVVSATDPYGHRAEGLHPYRYTKNELIENEISLNEYMGTKFSTSDIRVVSSTNGWDWGGSTKESFIEDSIGVNEFLSTKAGEIQNIAYAQDGAGIGNWTLAELSYNEALIRENGVIEPSIVSLDSEYDAIVRNNSDLIKVNGATNVLNYVGDSNYIYYFNPSGWAEFDTAYSPYSWELIYPSSEAQTFTYEVSDLLSRGYAGVEVTVEAGGYSSLDEALEADGDSSTAYYYVDTSGSGYWSQSNSLTDLAEKFGDKSKAYYYGQDPYNYWNYIWQSASSIFPLLAKFGSTNTIYYATEEQDEEWNTYYDWHGVASLLDVVSAKGSTDNVYCAVPTTSWEYDEETGEYGWQTTYNWVGTSEATITLKAVGEGGNVYVSTPTYGTNEETYGEEVIGYNWTATTDAITALNSIGDGDSIYMATPTYTEGTGEEVAGYDWYTATTDDVPVLLDRLADGSSIYFKNIDEDEWIYEDTAIRACYRRYKDETATTEAINNIGTITEDQLTNIVGLAPDQIAATSIEDGGDTYIILRIIQE